MIDPPWAPESKEFLFLKSALTLENEYQTLSAFLEWFEEESKNHFIVSEIPLTALDQWQFREEPYRLGHDSGKFFTIEGIHVETNYGNITEWEQPIINQPEIGILGIITRVVNGTRYCLMQVKMEPGNINIVQLSPTVQATKSNYTTVHKGKIPAYMEYFMEPGRAQILVDQLQSEQGSRFLRKHNRNMIVEIDHDIPVKPQFRWLTLAEIKRLLRIDNLVNMDSRTVLACIPFAHKDWGWYHVVQPSRAKSEMRVLHRTLNGFALKLFLSLLHYDQPYHNLDEIISWYTNLKSTYELFVTQVSLKNLSDWVITPEDIHHKSGRFFSVIGVSVEAGTREVTQWTQPLLKHTGYGIIGFITQMINDRLHFLVKAVVEPGNRDMIELGPTVALSDPTQTAHHPFLAQFTNPDPAYVRYNVIQSEEGGRFYHFQNRYMILELPENSIQTVPADYIWMTLAQIIDFTKYSYFNIEARNLLACLDLLIEDAP